MSNRYYLMMRDKNVADSIKHQEEKNTDAENFFNSEFQTYVNRHGYHFTPELAEYASKKMKNSNGVFRSWSCNEVKDTLTRLEIEVPYTSTIGDMTYTANMAYADFFPIVVTDIHSCVLYSRAVAYDPDGYEGIQFYRWLADLMATNTHVDWLRFV